MDHLQNDIDSLESERGALRDKLKTYSNKKGDLKATTAFGKIRHKNFKQLSEFYFQIPFQT